MKPWQHTVCAWPDSHREMQLLRGSRRDFTPECGRCSGRLLDRMLCGLSSQALPGIASADGAVPSLLACRAASALPWQCRAGGGAAQAVPPCSCAPPQRATEPPPGLLLGGGPVCGQHCCAAAAVPGWSNRPAAPGQTMQRPRQGCRASAEPAGCHATRFMRTKRPHMVPCGLWPSQSKRLPPNNTRAASSMLHAKCTGAAGCLTRICSTGIVIAGVAEHGLGGPATCLCAPLPANTGSLQQ